MRLFVLFLGLCLSVAPAQAGAQSAWASEEPCVPPKYDQSRTLNGHAFLPFLDVPWPFVTTRVGSLTGAGLVSLKSIPVVGLGVVSTDAKLASFRQAFRADFALTRYLGLSTGFSAGNAAGINQSGAFNLGLNYAVGATLGLVARIAETEKWYLSVRVDGVIQEAAAILPAALTSEAVVDESGQVTFKLSSLTRSGSIVRGAGAFMLATSPQRMVGIQGSLGFDTMRISVGNSTGRADYLNLGAGTTFRFNDLGAPVALLLGASLQLRMDQTQPVFFPTVGSQGAVTGTIEPGILYSNPKYVDVGLQMSFQVASNDHRKQAVLVLNHFW